MRGTAVPSDGASRVLLWLCALKIAAIILALDPSGFVAFQLPKALASRAFEWLIAASLAFALLRGGLAVIPRHRLHYAVLALIGIAALSAAFATDRYVAVFGDAENYQGLTYLIDMALLYFAVAVAVREERDLNVLIGAALAAGTIALAYGAAQAFGVDPFLWADDPRARPFSTFGNPDHFGHFLSVFFGLALGLAATLVAGRARLVAVIAVAVALALLAVVATRATLLGIGAAGLALVVSRRPRGAVLVVGAAATIVVGTALALAPIGQRVVGGGSVTDRVELWRIAIGATLARPLLGYGTDNFRAAFAAHRSVESLPLLGAGPQATAHTWILDASTTLGVVGLIAVLALVLLGTIELWRLATARPAVGVALLLAWCAYWGDGLVAASSLAASWFPWIALGAAVGLRGSRASGEPRAIPRWIPVALALAAIVGGATGARSFQANRDAWSAEEATHFGDRDAAVLFADRASARDGGRADHWNLLGLALEADGQQEASVTAYREATTREPYEAVYWTNLSRALARIAGTSGPRRDEAIAAAREATRVDPNAPVGHVALAEVATVFGRCDIAREEAARAAALERGHEDLVRRAADCR